MNIEQAIASGKLSPAARDMDIEQVIWQYAEANCLDEHEAEIELDEHHECIYNVYTLCEGAAENEQSFCNIQAAFDQWETDVRNALSSTEDVEITIHLYDVALGNMLKETCLREGRIINGDNL